MNPSIQQAFKLAIAQAETFVGQTSPNPPVGAAAIGRDGQILSVQAHERAGLDHAEVKVIKDCEERGILADVHTLVVTLEPCNHHGLTPPCTEAILRSGIKNIVIGAWDPNPQVRGGGADVLARAGMNVSFLSSVDEADLVSQCQALIEPFSHWARTGLPYVTLKTAFSTLGSMIPPKGQKTFASMDSMKFSHQLRKRADAILTGSGTVLADLPLFTVRHVEDHPAKKRWLIVLDRRRRISDDWVRQAQERGFQVVRDLELGTALQFLGSQGVLEVLVEAGPTLTQSFMLSRLWNRHVLIKQGQPDQIEIFERPREAQREKSSCLPESSRRQDPFAAMNRSAAAHD